MSYTVNKKLIKAILFTIGCFFVAHGLGLLFLRM